MFIVIKTGFALLKAFSINETKVQRQLKNNRRFNAKCILIWHEQNNYNSKNSWLKVFKFLCIQVLPKKKKKNSEYTINAIFLIQF